ncbi:inositol-3-phosphate synthase [Nocardiopsis sp. LSu2-4]|uniref:Inositol-3-phosphate synthase n=2 Tax=Nocardiopsis suaedae TaxID=3018444 RepID=A0ABT4TRZ5_9ACTN|nr:inositol-3-phosphate synthase [Nocardiopsis suaedae]MDA2807460.1 inositol-3-phosphate synthase [Nocardiopsis suaedae]
MMRTGVWLVGARGSVAATTIAGALAVRAGAADRVGCVADLPGPDRARAPGIGDLVFGGHDVGGPPLPKRVGMLAEGGVVPSALPGLLEEELAAVEARIRPGAARRLGRGQREAAARIEEDLRRFREDEGLDRAVVVDVSSTEPPLDPDGPEAAATASADLLEEALDRGAAPLPASSLYAYAAFRAGCPVASFTPSPGPRLPALEETALREGLCWAGSDGKTGETLLKSALAPMFAQRALRVRSWSSVNLLGGGDGETLADPANAGSKTASKGQGLRSMLGNEVGGPLHIDYVPDMGDFKTAWDHVSFEGFLGVRMSLQFTWAGCDSALAAPLVLDIARLTARAHEAGETGPLAALGFFFKDPAGCSEHALAPQWDALVEWCARLGDADTAPAATGED